MATNSSPQQEEDKKGLTTQEQFVLGAATALGVKYGPDQYSRTVHNYVWTHPSGETTKVQGFNKKRRDAVQNAMLKVDRNVRPDQKFHTTIRYTHKRRPYNTVAFHLQDKTTFGKAAFSKAYNADALFAHEMGHAIDRANEHIMSYNQMSGNASKNAPRTAKAFGWEPAPGRSPHGFRNFAPTSPSLRGVRYQGTDLIEDFAEHHRLMLGFKDIVGEDLYHELGPVTRGAFKAAGMEDDIRRKVDAAGANLYGGAKTNKGGAAYMRNNVFRDTPHNIKNVDLKRASLLNKRNVVVGLGGTALVGGGYYYVTHRKQIHEKLGQFEDKMKHFTNSHDREVASGGLNHSL